jgi:hypothetical protein
VLCLQEVITTTRIIHTGFRSWYRVWISER